MIKNLQAFTKSTRLLPMLHAVLVKPDRVVATDSFKLIEKRYETGVDSDVVLDVPDKLRSFEKVIHEDGRYYLVNKGARYETLALSEEYPSYEHIMPSDDDIPATTICVDAQFLQQVAAEFVDKKDNKVAIKIYGDNKAILFENDEKTVRALLMPRYKA